MSFVVDASGRRAPGRRAYTTSPVAASTRIAAGALILGAPRGRDWAAAVAGTQAIAAAATAAQHLARTSRVIP
jgi:hypothetical protein